MHCIHTPSTLACTADAVMYTWLVARPRDSYVFSSTEAGEILSLYCWYSHFTGLSLICFCQNSRLCEGEEEVCQSQNDVCFTRMLEDGMYESACYEVESNLFPAVLVYKCLNETHQSISPGELLCCSDRDRCNEDLHPSMQWPSSNDRGSTTFAAPIISSKGVIKSNILHVASKGCIIISTVYI